MFIIANFLKSIAYILGLALNTYYWCIIIRVLVSWVGADPYNPIVRFLSAVTDPLLSFLRRKMPFLIVGAVDLSPLVAVFIIMFARHFLVQTIFEIALRLS